MSVAPNSPKWLVIGGWSLPPSILEGLFPTGTVSGIDVNEVLPLALTDRGLAADWGAIIAAELRNRCGTEVPQMVAGWSTGAIVAAAIARHLHIRRLVLLSATPSFCIRPGHRWGQRPAVLERMRLRLARERETLMEDFARQCGVADEDRTRLSALSAGYGPEILDAGLRFLLDADVRPFSPPSCSTTLLHGIDDRIIPPQAGAALAELMHASFESLPGGHLFFLHPQGKERILRCVAEGM